MDMSNDTVEQVANAGQTELATQHSFSTVEQSEAEAEVKEAGQANSIYPLKITNKQIKQLQQFNFEGEIHQVTHIDQVPNVIQFLLARKVLGFDTETRPVKGKGQPLNPVCLMQFATEKNSFVIQLLCVGRSMKIHGSKRMVIREALKQFRKILESRTIWKVGSGIHADAAKIQEIMKFKPRRFVDTQNLCARLGMISTGLRPSCAILFGVCMKEFPFWANWESDKLGSQEVRYAAEDAVMSRRLYKELRRRLKVRGVTKVKKIGRDVAQQQSIFQHIEGILLGAAVRKKNNNNNKNTNLESTITVPLKGTQSNSGS